MYMAPYNEEHKKQPTNDTHTNTMMNRGSAWGPEGEGDVYF